RHPRGGSDCATAVHSSRSPAHLGGRRPQCSAGDAVRTSASALVVFVVAAKPSRPQRHRTMPEHPMPSAPRFKQESRALLRLASPIILSQIAQVLMGLVDTVMSGHAGAFEQAVVGLGVALWIPVFIALMNIVQAVSPI